MSEDNQLQPPAVVYPMIIGLGSDLIDITRVERTL